uniref:Uncharacterized protein n=1 Tax=Streptomyces sp. NBC_00049 TaxID=2903617 RepID=A0AAU2K1G4_9ACTN
MAKKKATSTSGLVTGGADVKDDAPVEQPVASTVQLVPVAGDSVATEAREALLKAIASEAKEVTVRHAGHASEQLEGLARAFALVVSGPAAVTTGAPEGRSARYSFYTPDGVTSAAPPEGMHFNEISGTLSGEIPATPLERQWSSDGAVSGG